MAKNQGLYRLEKGVTKVLNRAETTRNYLFVSKDTSVHSVLEGRFEVFVNDKAVMKDVRLDKYGRINGAGSVIKELRDKQFTMYIKNGCLFLKAR